MPAPITVDDLVDQVRDQIDESNTEDVSDNDILQALNRGQRKAANILAGQNSDFFITSVDVTTTATDTFALPEGAYGRRLRAINVVRGGVEYPLKRIGFRELARYTSSAVVAVPYVYCVVGRDYIIKPTPQSGVTLKLWYTGAPETLVLQQGRVSTVSVASTYVIVNALGDDLTTSTAELGAFVNLVDGSTGEIKTTLQVNSLTTATKTIAFKTSGLTYATVYNRTIATAIPTTVESGDYVCSVSGTCVPDLPDACLDYLVQYATTEIRRRMGEPVQDETAALKKLEDDIEHQWAGRELVSRVTNKARSWVR